VTCTRYITASVDNSTQPCGSTVETACGGLELGLTNLTATDTACLLPGEYTFHTSPAPTINIPFGANIIGLTENGHTAIIRKPSWVCPTHNTFLRFTDTIETSCNNLSSLIANITFVGFQMGCGTAAITVILAEAERCPHPPSLTFLNTVVKYAYMTRTSFIAGKGASLNIISSNFTDNQLDDSSAVREILASSWLAGLTK